MVILFLDLLFSCQWQPAEVNVYHLQETFENGRGFASGFEPITDTFYLEALEYDVEPDQTITGVTPDFYSGGNLLGVLQSVTTVEFQREGEEGFDTGCRFNVDATTGGTGDLFTGT